MGAKNNDSPSQKQAIVKFYTMEYRKCGNSNSKNDSRPCMGASAILKSVYFRAFAVNVKTIAPTQKLYQSGYAIWWYSAPMAVFSFLEENDLSGKKVVLFCSHGTGGLASSVKDISAVLPDSKIETNVLEVYRDDIPECQETINNWLEEIGY